MSLILQVSGGSQTPTIFDEAAACSLIEEINAIPRASAELGMTGSAPAGSKALGIDLAVLVALGGGTLIPSIIGVVRDWLARQPPTTNIDLKLGDFEFKWSGSTPPEQVSDLVAKLIERWEG